MTRGEAMRLPTIGGLQVGIGLATMLTMGTHAAHYIAVFGVLLLLVYGSILAAKH